MQLVIPMSGQGSRFVKAGITTPKYMLKFGGKTLLERIVENYPGVTDYVFILNDEHYQNPNLQLKDYFKAKFAKAKLVSISPHKEGPAFAIQQASNYLNSDKPIVVNYCDFDWRWDFSQFSRHLYSGLDGIIATYTGFHPHMLRSSKYAYVRSDLLGKVLDIREKESFTEEPTSEEASSGTYGFKSADILLGAIEKQIENNITYNGEGYISLTYKPMLSSNMHIQTFLIDKFVQLGTPEDYFEFENVRKHFSLENTSRNHNLAVNEFTVLAAGLGNRFKEAGYETPKPFLPINGGNIVSHCLEVSSVNLEKVSIVVSAEIKIPEIFANWCNRNKVDLMTIQGRTNGQAATTRLKIEKSEGNILVVPCDCIFIPPKIEKSNNMNLLMSVFLSKPSFFALSNPSQFGWVKLNSESQICETAIKVTPSDLDNWLVITGIFFFEKVSLAKKILSEFLESGETINSEYYLDSLIAFGLNRNYSVNGIILDSFMSLGTPNEYETYKYWFDFFSENVDYLDE